MLEEIQRYTESVENGTFSCKLNVCPCCGGHPEGFTRHDCRRRIFLVILERLIKKIFSLLTRWKCPLCGHPFTFYPPFALPHKRYVRQTVLEMGSRYVKEDRMTDRKPGARHPPEDPMTYRKAVTEDRMPVFHETTGETPGEESVPVLAHSTLHRWLTSISKLHHTLFEALRLIKEKAPTSEIFRDILPIHPLKYRSDGRRMQLQICQRLFQAAEEYSRLFATSVFPHLGTACGWR
jgi:hypothetical protein